MKVALLLALPLTACAPAECERVIAWPGMTAEEYNRLNAAIDSRLSSVDSDWIAVNSPMALELRYHGEQIEFATTAGAGGLQILSGSSHGPSSPPRVRSLSFDIGPSYMPVEEAVELAASLCDRLHRLAGTASREDSRVPPDAAALSRILRESDRAGLNTASLQPKVCFGSGRDLVFEITAYHYPGGFLSAEDFSLVGLDGYLARPLQDETG